MKNPVTISLIIPIYRVEKYIGRFAESVFGQSYPYIQYIFVNDETDDSTIDILKALIEARYSHLKEKILIIDQSHAGLPAARRTGMQYATGDYVWHIDSDDWIEKDAVAIIADIAEKSDSDLIYFPFWQEYADGSKIKCDKVYDISSKKEYIWNMFNQKSYACVWNKCIRRSVYERHEIYYPEYSYAEDAYLMIQLVSYCNSICYLDSSLYHYRKDNGMSLSHQKRRLRRLEYALNFMDLYEKLKDESYPDNPLPVISDAIMLRAGWYSIAFGLGLFNRFPYLSGMIRKAHVSLCSKVGVIPQLITKFRSFL